MNTRLLTRTDLTIGLNYINTYIPAKINQIYETQKRIIILKLFTKEKIKVNLVLDCSTNYPAIYLLKNNDYKAPTYPSSLCMKLRKHLKNKYIDKIELYGLDRVIKFTIGDNFTIVFEIFDKGNIILLDNQDKILTLIRRHIYEPNIGVSVGWEYPWHILQTQFDWDNLEKYYPYFEKWENGKLRDLLICNASPIIWVGNDLIKHIASKLKLNMSYNKNKLNNKDFYIEFLKELKQEFNKITNLQQITGYKSKTKFISYLWDNFDSSDFIQEEIYSDLITLIWHQKLINNKIDKKIEIKKQIDKQDRIKNANIKRIHKIDKKINQLDKLLNIYNLNPKIFDFLNTKILPNENIKRLEKNKIIFYFDNNEFHFDIELNYWQNLSVFYQKRKRFEEKKEKIKLGNLKAIEKLNSNKKKPTIGKFIFIKPKPFWYEPFYWFYTSNNLLVIAGKNSDQNELLVKKYMEKDDLYFHSVSGGSPSTIMKKGRTETNIKILLQVSNFITSMSHGWRDKSPDKVYYVYPEQVSKTPPSGEFLEKGSFMIRGKKNYLGSNLELGIGLYFRNKNELLTVPVNESCYPMFVIGDWKAITSLKFKYKILPGNKKRGKILKKIIELWYKKSEPLEKKYLNSLNLGIIVNIIPNNCKIIY